MQTRPESPSEGAARAKGRLRHHLYAALALGLFCSGFNLGFTPAVSWHWWVWAGLGLAWSGHAAWLAFRRLGRGREYTAWLVDEDPPQAWERPERPERPER
jgi:hypothetical protein